MLFLSHFYVIGIGAGWGPAVINSESEFKFIRENQHTLSDSRDFFVGGSTNSAEGENIEYFEYLTTDTGNPVLMLTNYQTKVNKKDSNKTC